MSLQVLQKIKWDPAVWVKFLLWAQLSWGSELLLREMQWYSFVTFKCFQIISFQSSALCSHGASIWVQALESCQGSGVGSHRKFGSQDVGTAPQGAGKQGGHSRVGMCGWASSGCVPMRILDTTFLHHKSPPTLSCSTVLVGAALSSCDDGIWSFTCPWKRNENSSWTLWGVVV